MAFSLPELPYATTALEPYLSAETFEYHYGKHHKAYVDTLNGMVEGTDEDDASLEDIILKAEGKQFNQAAQVWNHKLYWSSMAPGGGGAPTGAAGDAVNEAFGSFDTFKEEFKTAATGQFGSGWTWLTLDGGKLAISATEQRRPADEARPDRGAHVRRLGTRLLHRLPQRPARTTSTPSSTTSSTGSCSRTPSARRRRRNAARALRSTSSRLDDGVRPRRSRGDGPGVSRSSVMRRTRARRGPGQRLDHPPAGVDLEPAVGELGRRRRGVVVVVQALAGGDERQPLQVAGARCRTGGGRSGGRWRSPPPIRRGSRLTWTKAASRPISRAEEQRPGSPMPSARPSRAWS